MIHQIFYLLLLCSLNSVLSRHVPRYADLDEEDQQLFRAAYDTPSYDHDEYEEDDAKLDLMKDGLWAIKAKIKELKAFDKALAANMLSTKLKVKDLLENHMGEIIKHNHKKKPSYDYQAPSYQPQYGVPQYGAPQYGGAAPHYGHDPYYGH
ncbi:hypothetical protein evm_013243 [Chilo suppressalis]|nr:hypothetical protein evm_013243 [Chilo suppressalis]